MFAPVDSAARVYFRVAFGLLMFWEIMRCLGLGSLVYGFGGIANLDADRLPGNPLNIWFARHNYFPLIGVYDSEPTTAYLFSYGGLWIDLGIEPHLLWRKTRLLAFGATVLSLNGRAPQLLVDPTMDLASPPRTWRPATWILPLEASPSMIE